MVQTFIFSSGALESSFLFAFRFSKSLHFSFSRILTLRERYVNTHECPRVAAMYAHSLTLHPNHRDPMLSDTIQIFKASTQAYTRII